MAFPDLKRKMSEFATIHNKKAKQMLCQTIFTFNTYNALGYVLCSNFLNAATA